MTAKQHSDMAADSIEFECELPDPPEKVWRALTVPDLLAAWMMPNDIKPEIGSRFAFAKAGAPIECEILNAEPERLLRYSWRERPAPGNAADPLDSIVTFTLGRTASGGTHLRIVHDGFARVATSAVAMVGAGCRLSLNAHSPKQTIAANTPRLFLRAA
ncbi:MULTISPECIES: SRPBCC domain-containing protein [unclassified Mesorhizobium]|uniref:SRPBCC family protein n=1 Tax=unclassified Mesorhizobium TaxID=325217 RepID=UPI000FCBF85A|nr:MULTISPECIES: SRPBCC domain-containing protein [unclassified Mesorhizobium]RUV79258.1 SRPBCC domain-containing protein [Mesorhizobium sp. M5C.F.Ca.IN.020.14.1.1]RUV28089.1 SRPBCC domain-containing protein [Mesorhizobium sp. M5C.F.Ca.IN.020.32.2.1]RUV54358.1 SRPBCC domain-containing protein [Mesorhizobium sp. M5C.F.Ca.IN.020.29.1.1]RWG49470.1 MAG: SRPBCC domain-containing protein [Mesorhizobium sp.]RWH40703.1 MAG: SRPBCC domain-containing protein [Mesorhizobium sp.]